MTQPQRLLLLIAASAATLMALARPNPADFTVKAPADGTEFRLSAARGRYVALHFLLKTECPVCLRHTRDYVRRSTDLPDVEQVFLKPDSAAEILSWLGGVNPAPGTRVPVYQDPEAALATAFGIPGGYKFHGETVHYPALVLLNPDGVEVFRYVGKDNTDRLGFDTLAAKVAELKSAQPKPKP